MNFVDLLLYCLLISIVFLFLHEFGHYLVAKLFGWNPKVEFFAYKRNPFTIVSVIAQTHIEINSAKDFQRLHAKLILFGLGGAFLSLPYLFLLALFTPFMDFNSVFLLAFILLVYSVSETLLPLQFKTEGEA